MNPLKEHAHLFVNGGFKVLTGLEDDLVCNVHGYDWNADEFMIHSKEHRIDCWQHIDNCTLIARPIESLSEEEVDLVYPWGSKIRRQIITNRAREGYLNREPFLKLLEIGVYPFSQEDFGDTVIDSRTLKTTA